nr:hypothetical protein [uncultured Janthinobacterium sp.]
MSRFPDCFAPRPAPKPISAARWVPLAKKHGLDIDFKSKCASHELAIEFWGEDWCSPDVGACVVKVAGIIESNDRGTTLKKIGGKS